MFSLWLCGHGALSTPRDVTGCWLHMRKWRLGIWSHASWDVHWRWNCKCSLLAYLCALFTDHVGVLSHKRVSRSSQQVDLVGRHWTTRSQSCGGWPTHLSPFRRFIYSKHALTDAVNNIDPSSPWPEESSFFGRRQAAFFLWQNVYFLPLAVFCALILFWFSAYGPRLTHACILVSGTSACWDSPVHFNCITASYIPRFDGPKSPNASYAFSTFYLDDDQKTGTIEISDETVAFECDLDRRYDSQHGTCFRPFDPPYPSS